jgi:hypothetical protein
MDKLTAIHNPMRFTPKDAIKDEIKRLRAKANELEAFLNVVPDDLSPEAEEGFRQVISCLRRSPDSY